MGSAQHRAAQWRAHLAEDLGRPCTARAPRPRPVSGPAEHMGRPPAPGLSPHAPRSPRSPCCSSCPCLQGPLLTARPRVDAEVFPVWVPNG